MRRQYPIDVGLAQQFRRARQERHLTLNDIALATGMSESTIGKLETARVPFSPEHRRAVEQALFSAEENQRVRS